MIPLYIDGLHTDKVTCSLKGIGKEGQEASGRLWQAIEVTKGVHTTQLPPPILSCTQSEPTLCPIHPSPPLELGLGLACTWSCR